MRRYLGLVRYGVAIVALLVGFAFSIRFGERGFVLDHGGGGTLATANAAPGEYDLAALRLLGTVTLNVTSSYVEPDRVDPKKMLVAAIDKVQNTAPEVVAIFSPDMDDDPQSVEIRVGTESKSFDISKVSSLWEVPLRLRPIFQFLQTRVDTQETKLQNLEYAAINGMLDTLDPHTTLLDPDIYEEMKNGNRGNFGGLGITIGIRDGELTVISPIENTPASRAGFKSGDRIVKINDESTVNMPLDEAVSKLRGPPQTQVSVEVTRHGWSEPHKFTLTREIIEVVSVSSKALGDGLAYVEIRQFLGNTADEVGDALGSMSREMGGIKGLILDLRNNPGGLLREAVGVSDLFLQSGTIVATVAQGDKVRDEQRARQQDTQPNYPIVVLVNPGSASASEIVAGALKNNRRAIVIGDRTFGKGSVQNIIELDDGSALKITVAQYLTPGDISIQGVGVLTERWLAANFSEPVILVGNSFGGHVALRIAIERPELVRGLVLAGASGLIEKSMVADVQIRPSRDWLARKIGELFHDQRFMSEADLDRAFASLSKRGGARAMIKLSRSARRNHLGKKLGMIQCPTLLIWGKQDIVTPPEAAEGFLSSIRGSEIVWFDQCGHAPMIEKPAEFASALADFAERVSRAGTSGGHSAGPVVKHSGTASGTSR